ncbi:hypothetical protein B0F90DRAFT_1666019 [Multifurca ochricompacta]|uniref:Uncharacterized protein n=1 Tax=Multifurca ochricompacta TaxID=376703 RepID=A0AAD4M932_9AGAM|nr:hypothetical protein B0F90DRAFT_1666019 [Multifurca ochricompacta]
MGRTFSPAVTIAPIVVDPTESHTEIGSHFPRWSYENSWDPDSDAFFKDAVYEAFVPILPLEPITPVDSSSTSSPSSSGRGTPAELPPVLGQVTSSDQDVTRWLEATSPSGNSIAFDALPPLSPPRRHSSSELRRSASQSYGMSPAAFERLHTRQINRLPLSHPRTAITAATLQHPLLVRPVTPPLPTPPASSASIPVMTPNTDTLQPSPPPSVSPRIYNWTIASRPTPESPTVSSRIRVTPARWPVY